MKKGQKQPGSVEKRNGTDTAFIVLDTKDLALAWPEEIERAFSRLQDALSGPEISPEQTPLENILKRLENEALILLREKGYPTDENELWWIYESPEGHFIEGGDFRNKNILVQNAIRVLFSAKNVRDFVEEARAEDAALEMTRLVFAAVCANLHDAIIQGIRTKGGQPRGGEADKRLEGVLLAVARFRKGREKYSAKRLWEAFSKLHEGSKNAFRVGKYRVYYDRNNDEIIQQPSRFKRNRIGFAAFQKTYMNPWK